MPSKQNIIKIDNIVNKDIWSKNLNDFLHSVFITSEWIESLASPNHQPIYLNFHSNNILIGKLAGFIYNNAKIGGKQLFFYAAPALINCTSTILNACLNALYTFAKTNDYSRIVMGSYDQPYSCQISTKHFVQTRRSEFVIDLDSNIQFTSRFKRNVKKASKFNELFQIKMNSVAAEKVALLLSITSRYRHIKKRQPYVSFYLPHWSRTSLDNLISNHSVDIFEICNSTTSHCFELNLKSGKRIFNLLRGADEIAYENGLPAFLGKHMINYYKLNDYKTLNLGGIPSGLDGKNLSIFKRSMGAKEIVVYGATTNYITYPYKLLNPIISIGRLLPDIGIVNYLKRHI